MSTFPQRRRLLAGGLALTLLTTLVAGCSADGRETVRFTFSKREAIEYMSEVVSDYNASQTDVRVVMDTSGVDVVSAAFVRGNPPDIALANYNMEMARFLERGLLTDLSDMDVAQRIRPELLPLMDQYASYPGRTSALPYSVMAGSVIYNKEIFDEHGLEVPQTWSELLEVCQVLTEGGVDPFYGTFKDDWTVGQGWFDYAVGGEINIIEFFDEITALGTEVGPDSATSFQKDFAGPIAKMVELTEYTNSNAPSRAYNDGNLAFAQGQAAMYLQGPWAFSEIAKTSPDLEVGSFPLPMTEDPEDLKIRVNVDLAAWIPEGSNHQEAARDFLRYLYQPEIIEGYNISQLGMTPTIDAPAPDDPRIAGMVAYYDEGRFYQGPSVLVPKTIPLHNYAQALILGTNPSTILGTIDADWARLALRQPQLPSDEETTE